jgi:drug/metabolite transporter (DMT)-like permease
MRDIESSKEIFMSVKAISYVMLFFCNLFWAGNYIIGKSLAGLIEPIWINYMRWGFASILLLIISRILEKPSRESIVKNIKPLILMGFFGVVGYNTILYTALNYTSPLSASIINSLNPGLLVILSFFLLKEKFTFQKFIGILISLSGALIVITRSNLALLFKMDFNIGDLMMLVAIFMWSMYSIISKRLEGIGRITATAYSSLFAVAMLTPIVLIVGNPPTVWTPDLLIKMTYIVLFPSIGSFLLWNFSLKHIEVGKAGISINLVPVFITLISWTLGVSITPSQLLGGGVVIAGVLITSGVIGFKKALD